MMGLKLDAERDCAPYPVPVFTMMTCDGDHGLFAPAPQRFDSDGHTWTMARILRAGWKETYTADGRKLWLGPCCSGKEAA
jgi:hypothetical protein